MEFSLAWEDFRMLVVYFIKKKKWGNYFMNQEGNNEF